MGQSTAVRATITAADLAFYGLDDTVKVLEPGTHQVLVGSLSASFTLL